MKNICFSFSVDINGHSFIQGDTIRLVLDDYNEEYVYEVVFQNKPYFFVNTGSKPECYLGVSLDIEPGNYELKISEYKPGFKEEKQQSVNIRVKSGDFSVVNINFRPEKKKKIYDPKNARERKLINESLKIETPAKFWEGNFIRPVKGKVKGFFGTIRKSSGKALWRHKGVDFSAKRGTSIKAPASGRVILVGEDFNLHGKTVIIDHGLGVVSIYIHLDKIKVKEGQKIVRGGIIGNVGSTGLTTAPNLHWGIYVHNQVVDPLGWLAPLEIE